MGISSSRYCWLYWVQSVHFPPAAAAGTAANAEGGAAP